MPKANKQNLMLDRPTSHGPWPEGEYDPLVGDRIYDYLKSMGLAETTLREYISELIMLSMQPKPRLHECIIVAGQTRGNNFISKTRDRNYKPRLQIVRDLLANGTEIVYMIDLKTGFLEGMNSHGLGILNSTLMVYDDETALEHGTQLEYGEIIKNALAHASASDCISSMANLDQKIEGHTFVGDPNSLYSLEGTKHHDTIIDKLDPTTGFDVRTNHGMHYQDAGYTENEKPDDYLSSKVRKNAAEQSLSLINSHEQIAPAMLTQKYNPASNNNTFRRTGNLRTTSQVSMNLPNKEFLFYYFPNEVKWEGLVDKTPKNYEPQIKVRLIRYKEPNLS